MSLVEHYIDGTSYDKEQHAIETLQAFCPKEGYYVAFSGGKDSVCIKKLCDLAGVKYDAHYNVTSIDPPELVQFIKHSYPDVEFERIYKDGKQVTMASLIAHTTLPPTRIARYCCTKLKEHGGYGRMVVTGVRWAESLNRKNNQGLVTVYAASEEMKNNPNFRQTQRGGVVLNNDNDEAREMLESCYQKKKTVINPIIDWEDEDVWEFIHKYNIPYCKLYDEGCKRLGCIGCPMGTVTERLAEFERYPKYKNIYLMAFEKMLKTRESKGLPTPGWKSAEDVFEWWVGEKELPKQLEGQVEMEL